MILHSRPDVAAITESPATALDLLELLERLRAGLPDWHRAAACRNHPDISFFPRSGESAGPALQCCGRCPVRVPCLEAALADPDATGVWGGTTASPRIAMRLARKTTNPPRSH